MKKFYNRHSHKAGFAILFLIFFAPYGIYLIFKHKHFKSKTRYIVSAVALVWMSFIIIDGQPTEEEIQAEEQAQEEREIEREEKKEKKDAEKAEKQAEKDKEKADKLAKEEAEEQAEKDEEKAKKQAKKDEEEKKEKEKAEGEKEKEKAEDEWENYRLDLLDHYADAGIVNIQTDKHFLVFYAIVPNEYKLYTQEEKQYFADEIGTFLEDDIDAHFGDGAHVYFHYQDGNTMASRKMMGGWKIK